VVRYPIADVSRFGALFELRHDVPDLQAVQVGERVEIDQGRRLHVAEADTGRLEQAPLAAGIHAVELAAGGRFECFFDPFKTLAFRYRAIVQVNGELPRRFAVEKMVERDYAFDIDPGNIQCACGGGHILGPDVAMGILHGPQVVEEPDSVFWKRGF
jgi:hypothetical protein